MSVNAAKKRVTYERDKIRQVSHWDFDYLSMDEVEGLYARSKPTADRTRRRKHPRKPLTSRRLGLLCIATGVALLLLTVAAVRLL